MRFFLVAAAFAVSLVSAASSPQAAGKPYVLRQATRQQVVRKIANKGLRRRQSLPSAGVYPTCEGSPASGGTVYAVIQNVEQRNVRIDAVGPADIQEAGFQPIDVLNVESALDCTRRCIAFVGDSDCFGSQYTVTANPEFDINCELYGTYEGADPNDDATSTYQGFDCSGIQAAFEVGDLTCCNYYE